MLITPPVRPTRNCATTTTETYVVQPTSLHFSQPFCRTDGSGSEKTSCLRLVIISRGQSSGPDAFIHYRRVSNGSLHKGGSSYYVVLSRATFVRDVYTVSIAHALSKTAIVTLCEFVVKRRRVIYSWGRSRVPSLHHLVLGVIIGMHKERAILKLTMPSFFAVPVIHQAKATGSIVVMRIKMPFDSISGN